MPGSLATLLTGGEALSLLLLAILLVLLGVMGFRAWKQSRVPPAELERRRRQALIARGKMGDATLLEIRDHLVFYSYDVRGVEYTASQDISGLQEYVPADLSGAVGPIYVKYDARNPANSIVLSEEWNGLRTAAPRT